MAKTNLDEIHSYIPVILVVGYGKCGKDTTSDYLVEKYGYKKKGSGEKMRELQEKINPIIEHRQKVIDDKGIVCETITYKRYKEWQDIYGYEAAKEVKNVSGFRQSLVDLAESMKGIFGNEIWIDTVLPLTDNRPKGIVVSDGRNRFEAMRVLNYGGLVIRITRKGVGPANETEKQSIEDCNGCIHEVIENDGTREELYNKIDKVIIRYANGKAGRCLIEKK